MELYRWSTSRPLDGWPFILPYLGATAVFTAALLSKPSAATLPALLLCLDACGPRPPHLPLRKSLQLLAPWFGLALLTLLGTASLQADRREPPVDAVRRLILTGEVLGFYAQAVVWPVRLCIDYGLKPSIMLARDNAVACASAAWGIVACGLLWPVFPHQRIAVVSSIVPLAPVLGFVPFLFQDISTVADRYMYLAMLGPALALSAILSRWPTPWLRLATAAMLALAAGLSFMQTATWRDSITVNLHALRINGGTFTTLHNLGMAILDDDRPADAADCFRRAIALDTARASAHLNLALARHRLKQVEEAEISYRNALLIEPRYAKAHNNLGILLAQQGRLAEARDLFEAALNDDPALDEARRNLEQVESLLRRASPDPP